MRGKYSSIRVYFQQASSFILYTMSKAIQIICLRNQFGRQLLVDCNWMRNLHQVHRSRSGKREKRKARKYRLFSRHTNPYSTYISLAFQFPAKIILFVSHSQLFNSYTLSVILPVGIILTKEKSREYGVAAAAL